MNDLISVIVPVYKVEQYLRKCVDSILNQTYQNLEIILVDDGSPDCCGAICDEYARRDGRVKVIHKSNGGLSDARNAGLDIMTGDYVGFVDSDDWIEPEMYEKLLERMRSFDADLSFGSVADDMETETGEVTVKTSGYGPEPFAEDRCAAMHRYFHGSWAAWDKLYKAFLFQEVRYPVGEINEDEAIVLQLLSKCERVCYSPEIFYHYMKRPGNGSITAAAFSKKKLAWKDHCAANLRFVQVYYPDLEQDAADRYRGSLLWSLTEIALSDEDFSEEVRELQNELWVNRRLFMQVPFVYKQDRVRLWVLLHVPFGVYRKLIRWKRNVK